MRYKAIMNGKELTEHRIAGHDIVREMLNGQVIWEKNQLLDGDYFLFEYNNHIRLHIGGYEHYRNSRIYIDWGDGEKVMVARTNQEPKLVEHQCEGVHKAKIIIDEIDPIPPIFYFYGAGSDSDGSEIKGNGLTRILSSLPAGWGARTNITPHTPPLFGNCKSLYSIPKNLFYNNPDTIGHSALPDNVAHFFNCTSLEAVPSNMFIKTEDYTEKWGTMYIVGLFKESSIKRIPKSFFNGCKNTSLYETFYGCQQLISIEDGAFDGTGLISFSYTFQNSSIETITEQIKSVQSNDFFWCFNGCKSLRRAPELWESHPNADGTGCFRGCINAENYSEIPDNWK